MNSYNINTTLFGAITVLVKDGLFEYYTITLGGREMTTSLHIFEEFLNDENLKTVTEFIEHIQEMYHKARQAFFKCCHTNAVVSYFIESGLDEIDEDYLLETFGVSSVNEIAKEKFLEELTLRSIWISLDKENKIDCVLDFSLDANFTDELLVARFDEKFELYDIAHES